MLSFLTILNTFFCTSAVILDAEKWVIYFSFILNYIETVYVLQFLT